MCYNDKDNGDGTSRTLLFPIFFHQSYTLADAGKIIISSEGPVPRTFFLRHADGLFFSCRFTAFLRKQNPTALRQARKRPERRKIFPVSAFRWLEGVNESVRSRAARPFHSGRGQPSPGKVGTRGISGFDQRKARTGNAESGVRIPDAPSC